MVREVRVSSTPPAEILEVRGLRKVFPSTGRGHRGGIVAVDDVSFALPRGGSLAIVGESGSGKTTVARMLVGLEVPTSGEITFDGRSMDRGRSKARRRARARQIQMVFQDPYGSLDRRQTVGACLDEILRVHYRLTSAQRAERVAELAELVGLDDRMVGSVPRALSGGQRQRVAIARALAAKPEVLILDESVAALDVSTQAQILNLLTDVRDRTGISYILISHDLAVVRQITDISVVMYRGAIVERGTTAQILDAPQHRYTQLLRASVPGTDWTPGPAEPADDQVSSGGTKEIDCAARR